MNLLQFAFYLTGIILICVEYTFLLFVFFGVIFLYLAISELYPGAKSVSNRRKIMFASWSPPSQGIIHAKVQINMQKTLKFIERYPQNQRPTIQHIVCKAGSQVMRQAPDLNGKIVFGKFLKNNKVNLGMLAQLQQDCQHKSIQTIRDQLNLKVSNARKNKPQKHHVGRFIPTFVMQIFLKLLQFITNDLNISIPFLGIKSSPYGAAMLHSLSSIDCYDACAPFLGYSGCSVQLTINKIHQKVIVQDGKIKAAKIMIANFVVDHRYLDGGKAKKMIPNFLKVFQNPQRYSSKFKTQEQLNNSNQRIKVQAN